MFAAEVLKSISEDHDLIGPKEQFPGRAYVQ